MIGHKEGVEIVAVAIECLVFASERDADTIGCIGLETLGRDENVLSLMKGGHSLSIDHNGTRDVALEIDLQVFLSACPIESDGDIAYDGNILLGRYFETQGIGHLADLGFAQHGQFMAYAVGHCRLCADHGAQTTDQEDDKGSQKRHNQEDCLSL